MRLLRPAGVWEHPSCSPVFSVCPAPTVASTEDTPPSSFGPPDSPETLEGTLAQHLHPADLRGAAQLATEATHEATHLVEAVHAAVQALLRPDSTDAQPHTDGLTGWVYRTVRRITRLSGYGTTWALRALEQALGSPPRPDTRERRQLLSVLNGVLGDHLHASDSPLARSFSLRRRDGRAIDVDAMGAPVPDGLVVFVHGLCLSDRAWTRMGNPPGHVEALTAAVEGTPVFARYNTGRSIWANGRALSEHLEPLATGPEGASRIVLVSHSMGGLVARSAVRHARRTSAGWPDLVTETVYLGTPHRGAVLERAGAWIEKQLRRTPFTVPFAPLVNLRSRGIQDLRHGTTAPNDASPSTHRDDTEFASDRVFYVAGALTPNQPARNAVGDGLVPVSSALDTADSPRTANRRVFEGLGHLDLLHAPAVTEHLQRRLSAADSL